jgi:hypothetical protein
LGALKARRAKQLICNLLLEIGYMRVKSSVLTLRMTGDDLSLTVQVVDLMTQARR